MKEIEKLLGQLHWNFKFLERAGVDMTDFIAVVKDGFKEMRKECNNNKEQDMQAPTDDLNTANAPADGKWVFDENVTAAFNHMLKSSIPGYADMRDVIFRCGAPILRERINAAAPRPIVMDLGASRGESSRQFIEAFPGADFYLHEISQPMLEAARKEFHGRQNITIVETDLRQRHIDLAWALSGIIPLGNNVYRRGASLILSILTLIFVPINWRPNIIKAVYDSLEDGGMFIVSEKVQGSTYLTDNHLVDAYHQLKHDNGYTREAIERKRMSLEFAQVPLTVKANEDLLYQAGFKHVELIHRHLNFATWMAIK